MLYFICYTILLILSFFEFIFRYTPIKNVFFILSVLILFILLSFNIWSPDMIIYIDFYNNINSIEIKNIIEPLPYYIMLINKKIGNSFEEFYFINGLLIISGLAIFLKKMTPLPSFVILIFYLIPFYPDIVQIRFFLAIVFFFLAFSFFHKNKIKFYILIILSILSHLTILSIIPFFILRKFRFYNEFKKSNMVLLCTILCLIFIPKQSILPIVTFFNPKYAMYFESDLTFIGTLVLFLPFYLLNTYILYIYNYKKYKISDKILDKYNQIIMFLPLIQYANYMIVFQYFIRDFSRLTMNLSILSYIYLSFIIYSSKNHYLRIVLIIWSFITFYINFLLVDSEYFSIIQKTFESNNILDYLFKD